MLFSFSQALVAVVSVLPISTDALNIIVNNDDGFAAANIREFYRLLKAAGHNGTPLSMSTHVVPPADMCCVNSMDCRSRQRQQRTRGPSQRRCCDCRPPVLMTLGQAVFTNSPVLNSPSEFGIIPAGAPSVRSIYIY